VALDGQNLVAGDRILLRHQTVGSENGIYVIQATGAPLRAADLVTGDIAHYAVVVVVEGTVNTQQSFICTSSVSTSLVGTDALVWQSQTVPNSKLQNSSITITNARGVSATGLNSIALGGTGQLALNWGIVPDLVNPNTFTEPMTLSKGTAATSRTTGTLIVTGGVGVSGDIYASNTFNMSDERLKKDVRTIPDALDCVSNMRGCFFEWNEQVPELENQSSVGVIAQEMKKCAPLLVSTSAETTLLAVEYSKTVPYLIEAIKELKRKIEVLEQPEAKRARK
jgi:hypothetical protein